MRHFWYTVAVIELTDVAFAVDSILAAMALAGSRQDKLWVVITGGILGVILITTTVNLLIGSASAKWALLGPIFVPMLMERLHIGRPHPRGA